MGANLNMQPAAFTRAIASQSKSKHMSTNASFAPTLEHAEVHQRLDGLLSDLGESQQEILPKHQWYLPIKAVVEYVAAVILLLVLSPIILLAALAVRATSSGSAFYYQTRVGRNGRPFRLYKLRTMVQNAEALSGPVWATTDDPRVTRVGKFLRDTHIDEFPQLLNVLMLQMSLIGPRPERPEFVRRLDWEIPHYSKRHFVRPGITGIAQLVLPPDSDLDSVRRKLVYDIFYVRSVNPWLDLRILGATGWYLAKSLGGHFFRIFALPSCNAVEKTISEAVKSDVCRAALPQQKNV